MAAKDGDYFVCQSCGTKYTVEAARKMMVEGTVEVQGTVKVDNKSNIESYLQNARRAKEKEDWDEVEKYYNMVEQYQPSNLEAIFYSAYGKAKNSLLEDNLPKRQQTFKVLTKCVSILDDNYDTNDSETNKPVIIGITKDIIGMICSRFVYKETRNGNGLIVSTERWATVDLFYNLILAYEETLLNIIKKDDQAYLHECLITLYSGAASTGLFKKDVNISFLNREFTQHTILQKMDPSHVMPDDLVKRMASNKPKSGVMVAGIILIIIGALAALIVRIIYGSSDADQFIIYPFTAIPIVIGLILLLKSFKQKREFDEKNKVH